ncbi:Mu transposase C-terminal domain-containing protein [Streptosporangium sp. NPDC051023]|uniref:Mu transposase C-terminal domain-containing protein n=1 Tax=Streptosporangium sp. NPDC051023 TaxID=3155410 RepID=UPI00344DE5C5
MSLMAADEASLTNRPRTPAPSCVTSNPARKRSPKSPRFWPLVTVLTDHRVAAFRLDPTLAAFVGESVVIRYDPHDLAELRVFHRGAFICRAICAELAGTTTSPCPEPTQTPTENPSPQTAPSSRLGEPHLNRGTPQVLPVRRHRARPSLPAPTGPTGTLCCTRP